MLRVIIAIVALTFVCRWVLGKWPWDYLRGPSPRQQALRRARTLLGVGEGAGRDEIIIAHRRLTALVHPDRGGTTVAMQEANAARDLLLGELPAALGASPDDEPPQQPPE
jgi:hypothetical protein